MSLVNPLKLTATQKNVLRLIQAALIRSAIVSLRRTPQDFLIRSITRRGYVFPPSTKGESLDSFFSTLAEDSTDYLCRRGVCSLAEVLCRELGSHSYDRAVGLLAKDAIESDMLCRMPRAKRTRTKREPMTIVELRADKVNKKVREWERKLKVAKTKLAAYRKKQKYYEKKGVGASHA